MEFKTFTNLIGGNSVYLDKTQFIYEMLKRDVGAYFLSRPKRFEKSLWISTLNEIFLGNKELFKGLYIYETNYDWKK